ncbi:MAG: tRNA uridine-5-carboxymethylaminomethyl(34) synthesis GTPase MnmE [Candidatus Aminicenantales bacterium]
MKLDDTIIAVSTPPGFGGLGIVRLSGRNALNIAKKIFRPKKRDRAKIQPRQAVFGNLYDFEKKEYFDEGILTFFPEPDSYTTENVVEISCHGSPAVLEEAVRLGIKAGARHADPGEFTLRAYLRGRIDIIQAEAINGLIRSTSLKKAKIAFGQLEGGLSKKITAFRNQIIRLLALIEAAIEFPEEGLRISPEKIAVSLGKIVPFLRKLISSYDAGRALAEGLTLAITGRTNVGKSTLFNSLLEEQRAIVTPFPGTTRDYLREKIRIKDALFNLVDMAGLGRPVSPVEKEGIKKGKKIALNADGLLLVLDSSRKETPEDLRLIREFKDKKVLLLFNKMDLPQKINMERIRVQADSLPFLEISALKGTNLDKLREKIHDVFVPHVSERDEIILHVRQKILLEQTLDRMIKSFRLLNEGFSEEIYAEEIRRILPIIGELTGEIRADEVIADIFSRFCVGK